MRQDNHCIFCKIVRAEAPAVTVFEDEHTLAFMDIRPASAGHTLIIAKEHFRNLLDIEEAAVTAVTLSTRRLAQALQKALVPDGIRVSQFNGSAAGQTVFHYHVHIVPIQTGQRTGAHGRAAGDMDEIKAVAEKIRTALLA